MSDHKVISTFSLCETLSVAGQCQAKLVCDW